MKHIYKIRFSIAIISLLLAIAGICGIFYSLKIFDIQFLPVLQRVFIDFSITALILFLGIIILTLIFGRLYCSLLCPLGIIQEIAGNLFFRGKRKNKYTKNYPIKYFIAAITIGVLAGGSAVAITQDISDLFSLENGTYGKSILNNSEIKTFFYLEEENIKNLTVRRTK